MTFSADGTFSGVWCGGFAIDTLMTSTMDPWVLDENDEISFFFRWKGISNGQSLTQPYLMRFKWDGKDEAVFVKGFDDGGPIISTSPLTRDDPKNIPTKCP